jgi:hypothetical protein
VKKVLVMALILGLSIVFMAGCGKKEEPASALDSLTKKAANVASDANVVADKAAADLKSTVAKADAKATADKAAADAKATAAKADAKAAADKAAADAKAAADKAAAAAKALPK